MLCDHHQSQWFVDFLGNCEQDTLHLKGHSIWPFVVDSPKFVDPAFAPSAANLILPISSMKRLTLWSYVLQDDNCFSAPEAKVINHDSEQVFWMPDDFVQSCQDCGLNWNLLRRLHHCRACGGLFCGKCSSRRILLPKLGLETPQRCCESCYYGRRQDSLPKDYG